MNNDLFSKAQESLKKYWGFPSFRQGQDKVIQAVLEGKNTIVLFPTGGISLLSSSGYGIEWIDDCNFSTSGSNAGSS